MRKLYDYYKSIFTNEKNEVSQARNTGTSIFLNDKSSITPSNAQKIATVLSCVNVKANALAVMPIKTYKRTTTGKQEDHANPLYNILRYEPNTNLISSLYKKIISQDLDLRGNHYSQIVRNGIGEIVSLYPLISENMEILSKNGKKIFNYNGTIIKNNKIMHLFDIPDKTGIRGISRIEYAKETLEFANSTSKHGNKLFKNSAMPSGSFEMSGELSDEAYNRLKKDLETKYSGLSNAGKTLLLEGGLTFKPLTISNSDSEWLESRKFNREELCGIFGVPSSMINDTANTAYGNLEQKYLEFYSGTVYPLTTIIEEQFRQSLLTPTQKKTTSIKFKYNAMLRVDIKTKTEYYKARFNIGSISPNEVRAYEDENGFTGGDERYVQLNLTTVKNLNKGIQNNG
ncbi:MAG: phage portal protein [Sulfurimonas sp.]